jgi:hypothetical protein
MEKGEQRPGSRTGGIIRKAFFWEFARGSWQYDLIVAAILLFLFATPREWFGDQPRASNIVLISDDHGSQQIFLEPDLLDQAPPAERAHIAADLIRKRTGRRLRVVRVDPIRDEKDLRGFIAYTTAQK